MGRSGRAGGVRDVRLFRRLSSSLASLSQKGDDDDEGGGDSGGTNFEREMVRNMRMPAPFV